MNWGWLFKSFSFTSFVAGAALVLSIINFWRNRTNARVIVWPSLVTIGVSEKDDEPLFSRVCITVENIGGTSLTIVGAGLLQPGEIKQYSLPFDLFGEINRDAVRLPRRGCTHDFFMKEERVKKDSPGLTADKYVAYVKDATGRFFYSHSVLSRYNKLGYVGHRDDKFFSVLRTIKKN